MYNKSRKSEVATRMKKVSVRTSTGGTGHLAHVQRRQLRHASLKLHQHRGYSSFNINSSGCRALPTG